MSDTKSDLVPYQHPGILESSRPDFIPHVAEGTEHIGREDIRVPRLRIGQGLSPQLKRADPKYIPELKLGDLFNDLTGYVYGAGPLEFHIVRADPPRWVEFIPRDQGGGIKDMDVPAGDPRTQWTTNDKGERQKPIASMFYDYVLLLWPSREMIALSLTSSGIKIAKALNGLIKLRNAPVWAGRYLVTVADEPSANGPFPNYVIKNAGWVVTREDGAFLKSTFDGLQGKTLDIEREQEDETPQGTPQGQYTEDNIPF